MSTRPSFVSKPLLTSRLRAASVRLRPSNSACSAPRALSSGCGRAVSGHCGSKAERLHQQKCVAPLRRHYERRMVRGRAPTPRPRLARSLVEAERAADRFFQRSAPLLKRVRAASGSAGRIPS
jgi:hypothetical protein